jgi:hypothetical protein
VLPPPPPSSSLSIFLLKKVLIKLMCSVQQDIIVRDQSSPMHISYVFFTMAQKPPCVLMITLFYIPHSVALIWMRDQSYAGTTTWQHTTLKTDILVPGGIRKQNPSKWEVADSRFRPRGHWGRLSYVLIF